MRKIKLMSFITIVLMILSAFTVVMPILTQQADEINPRILDDQARHRIETAPINTDFSNPIVQGSGDSGSGGSGTSTTHASVIGDQKLFLALDDYNGYYFFTLFTLYAQSENGEVWVQNNRDWPASNPRDNSEQEVTQAQAEYLLDEFETNIYAQEAAFYGTPGYQNGTFNNLGDNYYCQAYGLPDSYCDWEDSNGRTAILVENVRDDNYYTPGYPVYIAGFYSSTLDGYFDRNIMTIDSYDWINRVGPDGNRPYTYESTFAHEYQHLIHSDYISGDSTFINEGFSMYAEYLCGYGVDYGYVNAYFAQPWNSLTEWGDLGGINILGDYGEAMLFIHYLEGHYPGFQTTFMQNGVAGIDGLLQSVNEVNPFNHYYRHKVTFDELFNNFHLANLIQADYGPYSYSTVDFSQANPLNVQTLVDSQASGFSNTYGTNYILLDGLTGLNMLRFYGDEASTVYQDPGWTLDSDGFWYAGTGDLVNRLLEGNAYVDPADPTLSFYTEYLIEEGWDYGFVQVSTDGGSTWTSLANAYTTTDHDPSAHPDIVAQLPGLTGGPVLDTMTFDLSAYAGQNVMIGFRYMTDWSYNDPGWWIDSSSVTVSGSVVSLANEAPPPPPTVDFDVTIVSGVHGPHGDSITFAFNMHLNKAQDGFQLLSFYNTRYYSNFYYVVVTPTMSAGTANFQLSVDSFHYHHHH